MREHGLFLINLHIDFGKSHDRIRTVERLYSMDELLKGVLMPAIYFLPVESNRMSALASVHALRRHYEVLARNEAPDHTGLLVTTATPVAEKDQRVHGLKPLEDL